MDTTEDLSKVLVDACASYIRGQRLREYWKEKIQDLENNFTQPEEFTEDVLTKWLVVKEEKENTREGYQRNYHTCASNVKEAKIKVSNTIEKIVGSLYNKSYFVFHFMWGNEHWILNARKNYDEGIWNFELANGAS